MRLHYYEPENKAQGSSAGRAWVPEAKEVQDATICWQDDGHSILGRKRRYYVGLFTQEKYNNWSVLCKLVSKLSKGQRESPHWQSCNGCCRAKGYELIPHPA